MSRIYESHIEEWVVELLEKEGYTYLAPEAQEAEREDLHDVVLEQRLRDAVALLNPNVPEDAREDAIKKVKYSIVGKYPNGIRGRFSEGQIKNIAHASDSLHAAEHELRLFEQMFSMGPPLA